MNYFFLFIYLINLTLIDTNGFNLNSEIVKIQSEINEEMERKKLNESIKLEARHLYLPPSSNDFILPEIIENRIRKLKLIPTKSSNLYFNPIQNYYQFRHNDNKLRNNYYPELKNQLIKINSMMCKNVENEVYFRASLNYKSFDYSKPIIDTENINKDLCNISKVNDEYKIDLNNQLFWECGVKDCSTKLEKFYCLNLRFPSVSGLKLKNDVNVLLKCRSQERTTSHTKKINIKPLDTSGRLAPRIATGGYINEFESNVGLYRKTIGTDNLFNKKIESGGTVILGEEILLKVTVRDGDGWRYSRIDDVSIHYIDNKKENKVVNSVWILDSNGCVNPLIRDICHHEQYRVNPLESYLIFETFMFDNMKDTDEMMMNVKVTGCLDGNDCIVNCPFSDHLRKTRSIKHLNNQTINSLDSLSFKVILPMKNNTNNLYYSIYDDYELIILYFLAIFSLIVIAILIILIKSIYNNNYK